MLLDCLGWGVASGSANGDTHEGSRDEQFPESGEAMKPHRQHPSFILNFLSSSSHSYFLPLYKRPTTAAVALLSSEDGEEDEAEDSDDKDKAQVATS